MSIQVFTRVLCYVIYVLMTAVSIAVIWKLTTLSLRLIRSGGDDESILKEYDKECEKQTEVTRYKLGKAIEWIFSCLLFVVFAGFFLFSGYVNIRGDVYFDQVPTAKVVLSSSMSEKHESSTYLYENDLNDQFDTFDLIFVYKAPDPSELKLYDVIVFTYEDTYVVHRIVEIQEPNERHPDEYWFRTQGDAVGAMDAGVVKSSQIQAVYRGEHIKFIGTFVLFMQAPIGWLCLLLIAIAGLVAPVIDNKLQKERKWRLEAILFEESQGQAMQAKAQRMRGAMGAYRGPIPQGTAPRYVTSQPVRHIQNMRDLPKTVQRIVPRTPTNIPPNMVSNGPFQTAVPPTQGKPIYIPQEEIIQRIENGVPVRYAPIPGTTPVRYVRIAPQFPNRNGQGGERE